MQIDRLAPVLSTLKPSNHPYLNGAWTPQHEEVTAITLEVIEGTIPTDIDGVYLRNTENQLHQPLGKYHPFDGDGMIHQISFANGTASYRNRWVRTRCFAAEQEASKAAEVQGVDTVIAAIRERAAQDADTAAIAGKLIAYAVTSPQRLPQLLQPPKKKTPTAWVPCGARAMP